MAHGKSDIFFGQICDAVGFSEYDSHWIGMSMKVIGEFCLKHWKVLQVSNQNKWPLLVKLVLGQIY